MFVGMYEGGRLVGPSGRWPSHWNDGCGTPKLHTVMRSSVHNVGGMMLRRGENPVNFRGPIVILNGYEKERRELGIMLKGTDRVIIL